MIAYRQNFAALAYVSRPKTRQRKPILSLRRHRPMPLAPRRKDIPHGDAHPAGDLLQRIESATERQGITITAFGRSAVNDPNIVHQMRQGRRIRENTRQRIVTYMAHIEGEA